MRLAVNGARAATVALATGGLAGGLLVASTAAAQAAEVDADQDYNCIVIVNGTTNLGSHVVGVNTVATLPDTYVPGETIPSRQVDINLTLDEGLRASTYGLVGGRSAEGGSDDTRLGLKNSGQTSPVPIVNLQSLEATNIPATAGTPWIVPAQGTVPPVPVPAQASGPTQVLMPTAFNVDATIYTAEDGGGNAIPATMDCTITDDSTTYRRLATIQEEGGDEPVAPVAEDTTVSTTPGKAVKLNLAAEDPDTAPEDLGYAAEEPANGTVTGPADDLTYTPDDGFVGTDSFGYTVTDESGNTDTGTVTVKVAKAASTTKVSAPKRSKAGKPVTMKVSVNSDPAATGKATVKLGAKTLDTANVKNGKATLTVPAKSTKKLKGAKTFTVTYGGSDAVKGSSTKVKVTFTK